MTYDTAALVDDRQVAFDPGTSLLLAGPSMSTEELLYDLAGEGTDAGQTSVIITTNRSARDAVRAFQDRDAFDPGRIGVIDCTGQEGEDEVEGVPVRRLGSPGDLTGMSLEFAKLVDRFDDAGTGDEVRVGLASISTLLMYTDVRTAFRFLHVFTSRIRSGELLGLFTMDPGMHDQQTVNTVRAVFDAEARVDDDGSVDLRGSGYVAE